MENRQIVRAFGAALITGVATASLAGCSLIDLMTHGAQPQSTEGGTSSTSSGSGTSSSTSGSGSGHTASIYDVKVGDCFDLPSSGDSIKDATIFDSCNDSHHYEAYYSAEMQGSSFPGEDQVKSYSEEQCKAQFTSFVSDTSKYDYSYITPTQESWSQSDDREVLCVIQTTSGDASTGSAKK